MGHRSVTREMPQLAFRASFEPSTVDVDKRTVKLTWTTGARVLRGFWERFYEELSLDPKHVRMGRLQSGAAPLLNAHSSYDISDVIGVVEDATLTKSGGEATVRFDSGVDGEEAFRKVREGILRNISVGYATYKMLKVEDGEETIPVYRAVDWEPHEISIVPIGADAGAVTRSGGGANLMTPCEFIQERHMPDPVPENKTPTTTATATPAPTPTPAPQPVAEQRSAADIERERVLGIQRIGRTLNRPQSEIDAAVNSPSMTIDAFRTAAVDAMGKPTTSPKDGGPLGFDRQNPVIVGGEDLRDKFQRGAVAWIIQRAALAPIVAGHAKATGQTFESDPGEFRGLSMVEIARRSLELAGVRTAGMSKMEIVGAAFTRGGMATTSDFPVLLENALNKVLLARYATTPDTWRLFCKVGSVSDFRASKRYRQGSFGTLDGLNEHGEFKQKSIPDGAKESLTAGTKGNIIAISRQAIVNDDMGAFNSLAMDLGRAAALSIEVAVYALLAENAGLGPTMADGKTLFHADHNNITAGAALAAAALDLDRVKLGQQTDVSGNEVLDLTPSVLLLSKTLGGQARVINDSSFDPDTVANKAQMKANIAGKMFEKIVDTARITTTRRYVLADPSSNPIIEVAFLDGQQTPVMESQNGFDLDGVKWKVRHDFGVAGIDYRGAVTNAGA